MEIELLHIPHYEDGLSYLERERKALKMSLALVGRYLLQVICQLVSIEEIFKFTEITSGCIYRILKECLGVRKVCA